MHTCQEIQAAHARIAMLTAHLASGHAASTDILEVSDCAAPTFARPVAVGTGFGRPAAHEGPTSSQVKPLTLARFRGPVYQPTKPGSYTSYAERASAAPRFARPKAVDIKPEIISQDGMELQVNIVESKTGYQMEMALPGIAANEVRLELHGTDLVITSRQAMSGRRMGGRGLASGMFKATSKLPGDVDTTSVRADLVNGLLRIKARKQTRS
ncbi:hypothetical protein WJX77_006489 [Trebouxia sp. C0004]